MSIMLHDVPEDRAASDLDHRFGLQFRFLGQARAQSSCENDNFHEAVSLPRVAAKRWRVFIQPLAGEDLLLRFNQQALTRRERQNLDASLGGEAVEGESLLVVPRPSVIIQDDGCAADQFIPENLRRRYFGSR